MDAKERAEVREAYGPWAENHPEPEYRSVARRLMSALDALDAADRRLVDAAEALENAAYLAHFGHSRAAAKREDESGEKDDAFLTCSQVRCSSIVAAMRAARTYRNGRSS